MAGQRTSRREIVVCAQEVAEALDQADLCGAALRRFGMGRYWSLFVLRGVYECVCVLYLLTPAVVLVCPRDLR
jgi:hypothetical protein